MELIQGKISSLRFVLSPLIFSLLLVSPVLSYSGGTGTSTDPYQISSVEDWQQLMNTSSDWSKSFILTTDLDLDGITVSPIGTNSGFTGTFNGQFHIIRNVSIIQSDSDNVGLFSFIYMSGKVEKLGLVNVDIQGRSYVGGLCGENYSGTISQCYATGIVTGNNYSVGGLCGVNISGTDIPGTISQCYAACDVVGGDYSYNSGGLCGSNGGTISQSFAIGMVAGSMFLGGLCGSNGGTISQSFATGTVVGSGYLGGLCGSSDGTISSSFWDMNTSGQTTSAGGEGKTTVQMKDIQTYLAAGWDFTHSDGDVTDWYILDYPQLIWEKFVTIPDTVQMLPADAHLLLLETELKGTISFAPSSSIPAGQVISQNPAAGTQVRGGSSVNMVVSIGAGVLYGSGTTEAPYQISSAWDLIAMGLRTSDYEKCFIQTVDIDLSGLIFEGAVIANTSTGTSFTGVFDGNNHTISNLIIRKPDIDCVGLFGNIRSGGQVKKLGMVNASIQGRSCVGSLCGLNTGAISQCYAIGSIVEGDYRVGGLCGDSYGGSISQCYASGSMIGRTYYVGGLCGENESGMISQCYASGWIMGNIASGGLCGGNRGGIVSQSYATGWVTSIELSGGLCGLNDGTISNSFWDMDTSGQTTSSGGEGKTTLEMKSIQTYISAGWDFVHTDGDAAEWYIFDNSYPKQIWQFDTTVPQVVNFQLKGAINSILAAELNGIVVYSTSTTIPAGHVISQSPSAGTQAQGGSTVNMVVSIGPGVLNGSGTAEAPYQISSAWDLVGMGLRTADYGMSFVLTTDIDLADLVFERAVIAPDPSTTFGGTFDGNGHTISNLTIQKPNINYIGLFGYFGGLVKKLGLINVSVQGQTYVGGLCGNSFVGTIDRCYVTGTVGGSSSVGGLCGSNSVGPITQCNVMGTVSGSSSVGGLCGYNTRGTISQCFSTGEVSGIDNIGGLCGGNTVRGNIISCYTYGSVRGQSAVGGLVGSNGSVGPQAMRGIISQCYSTAAVIGTGTGGLCGSGGGTISSSFWDMDTSGQSSSAGGVGKTTAQMKDLQTYLTAGWDFVGETTNGTNDIWAIVPGMYPAFSYTVEPVTSVNQIVLTEGQAAEISVHLLIQPNQAEEISLAIEGDTNFEIITDRTLVFSPENWNQAQVVSLKVKLDANYLNDTATLILCSRNYQSAVALREIDIQPVPPAEVIMASTGTLTIEENATGQLSVWLAEDPLGPVEVNAVWQGSAWNFGVTSGQVLNFDSSNYHTPQIITIKARLDANRTNDSAVLLLSSPNLRRDLYKTLAVHEQDTGGYLMGTLPLGETVVTEAQPVLLTNVVVPLGSQLVIGGGTVLKLSGSSNKIHVEGELVVQGTSDNPVVVTSDKDDTYGGDTNGDGTNSNPAVGDWQGIVVGANSHVTLQNAIIRYAMNGIGTSGQKVSIVLNGVSIVDSYNYGLSVDQLYCTVQATNCLIARNGYSGVYLITDNFQYAKSLRNCTLTGNGSRGGGNAGIYFGSCNLTLESCVIANNASYGLFLSGDAPQLSVRYCNIFQNTGTAVYGVSSDFIGSYGNISADPLFVNVAGGNYEPGIGSPLIDAGYGSSTALTDIRGMARHDDTGMPNVGYGVNWITDIGAFERQTDTEASDLAISYVSQPSPEVLELNGQFSINWTVSNIGTQDYSGNWREHIWLSADTFISPDDILLQSIDRAGPLTAGTSSSQFGTMNIPAGVSGLKYVLVTMEPVDGASDINTTNNTACSDGLMAVGLEQISTETPLAATIQTGQWHYYLYPAESGKSVRFILDSDCPSGGVYLYSSYSTIPTSTIHDVAGDVRGLPDQIAVLPSPTYGNYFVAVYADSPVGGLTNYTLGAALSELQLTGVTPVQIGNGAPATVAIDGVNFKPDTRIELVSGQSVVAEALIYYEAPQRVYATFHPSVTALPAGIYSLRASNTDRTEVVTLADSLTVQTGGTSDFFADILLPGMARPGRVVSMQLTYGNRGTVDLFSPLLTLTGPQSDCEWCLPLEDTWRSDSKIRMMALSTSGPANILRPGQTETVTVRFRTPFNYRQAQILIDLHSLATRPGDGSEQAIDWDLTQQNNRPSNVPDELWLPFWSRVEDSIGQTWADAIRNLGIEAAKQKITYPQVFSWDKLFNQKVNQILAGNSPFSDYTCDPSPTGYGTGPIKITNPYAKDNAKTEVTLRSGPLGGDSSTLIKKVCDKEKPSKFWEFKIVDDPIGTISMIDSGIKEENGSARALLKAKLVKSPQYYGDLIQNIWSSSVIVGYYAPDDYPKGSAITHNKVSSYLSSFSSNPNDDKWYKSDFASSLPNLFPNDVSDSFTMLQLSADQDDLAIFYFVGHGSPFPAIILNHDGNSNGINKTEFQSEINKLNRVGQVVVILDSCFSKGMFDPALSTSANSFTWVASAQNDQNSGSDVGHGSWFSLYLLNAFGIPNNDISKDGKISLKEAFKYAASQQYPPSWVNEPNPRPQQPFYNGDDVIFDKDLKRPFRWIQIIETSLPSSPDRPIDQKVDTQNNWPFAWSEAETLNHCPNPQNGTIEYCDSPSRGPSTDGLVWRAHFILAKWDGGTKVKLYRKHQWSWEFKIDPAQDPTIDPPPGPPHGPWPTPTGIPRDPEDKFGPAGYDLPGTPEEELKRFIRADETVPYRIEVWNHEDAEVPAQVVTMRDTLDPAVWDLSTLEFTRIGFLKWDIELPARTRAIDRRIDLRPDMGLVVDVTTTVDSETGLVMWRFQCKDPLTGDYPEDPTAGFLPPFNKETGYEMGWMEFRVKPVAGMTTGTVIANRAYGEFDDMGDWMNNPAPKLGPWTNTVDAGRPTSTVSTLPVTSSGKFTVSWTGNDDAGGSGVARYDIYVSTNSGPFIQWLSTEEDSAEFEGESGTSYAFYSLARDHVGNVEEKAPAIEAVTQVMDLENMACRLRPSAPPIRIGRSIFEYHYQVEVPIQIAGVDLDRFTIEVASSAPGLTIEKGIVSGLSVDGSGKVVSNDSITIRIDRKDFTPPAQLSWSLSFGPPAPSAMAMGFFSIGTPGDYDGNGVINLLDVLDLSLHWLQSDSPFDITGDGRVNMDDFTILSDNFQP